MCTSALLHEPRQHLRHTRAFDRQFGPDDRRRTTDRRESANIWRPIIKPNGGHSTSGHINGQSIIVEIDHQKSVSTSWHGVPTARIVRGRVQSGEQQEESPGARRGDAAQAVAGRREAGSALLEVLGDGRRSDSREPNGLHTDHADWKVGAAFRSFLF